VPASSADAIRNSTIFVTLQPMMIVTIAVVDKFDHGFAAARFFKRIEK
jgi:hypothetical protein